MKHPMFFSRTVLLKDNNFEEASRILNRILGREGVISDIKRIAFYEKPWQARRRINYAKCSSICNEDYTRKINMLLRKNRVEPFPGCY